MRAIKFRAISLCNGERWIYGDLMHYNANPQREKWTIHEPQTGIETDIDEKTIGQFTGFIRKDKDGHDVEVYEGDIVHVYGGSINYDYYSVVRWDEHGGCWYLRDELNLFVSFGLLNKEFITVIGNIYDNPEPIER